MNIQDERCFRVFIVSLKGMFVFSYIKRKTIKQKMNSNQNFLSDLQDRSKGLLTQFIECSSFELTENIIIFLCNLWIFHEVSKVDFKNEYFMFICCH